MISVLPGSSGMAVPPSSRPVRIFGPDRSCSTGMWRPARTAASRTILNRAACSACVPWEKLKRNMSAPAAMSESIVAGSLDAGPRVAMIFV